MKPLVAGLIGALVAVVLITGWNGRTSAESQLTIDQGAARGVHFTGTTRAADDIDASAALGPVSVQCAPGQRAVVRQVAAGAGITSHVDCVAAADDLVTWNGYAPASSSPRVVPAVYSSAPSQERVVYRERRSRSGRSWKKTALVIGGSTGAGAGVGAIAGGKKGALIGAAIGGGAATLYEAVKRR